MTLLDHARDGFRSEFLGCAVTHAEDTQEAEAYRLGRTYADAYRRRLLALLAPAWMPLALATRVLADPDAARGILSARAGGCRRAEIVPALAAGTLLGPRLYARLQAEESLLSQVDRKARFHTSASTTWAKTAEAACDPDSKEEAEIAALGSAVAAEVWREAAEILAKAWRRS